MSTLRGVIRPRLVSDVTCLRAVEVPPPDECSERPTPASPPLSSWYLFVGYASGVVAVYNCATYRELWSAQLHDAEASVIELHVASHFCGTFVLFTQSRRGEVTQWEVDWAGRRFVHNARLDLPGRTDGGGAGAGAGAEVVYSFARMCFAPGAGIVAFPSGEKTVTVCVYGERLEFRKFELDFSQSEGGMVTSLSATHARVPLSFGPDPGPNCQERGGVARTVALICVGFESGLVKAIGLEPRDSSETTITRDIPGIGTDPCVALGCMGRRSPSHNDVLVARGFAGDGTGAAEAGEAEAGEAADTSSSGRNPPLVHLDTVSFGSLSLSARSVVGFTALDHEPGARVMDPPKGMTATLRGMDQIVYRDDGKYVAVACWDGKVRIYKVDTGKLVDVIAQHAQAVTCFAFVSCKLMALGSRDGTVSIHSI